MARDRSSSGMPQSPPNRRFIYLLNLAQRRVQQWSQDDREGMSSAQAGVLFLLRPSEGVPIGDVARALGAGAAGISGLVDRMEAAKLVRRESAPDDGRAVRVMLTERGRVLRDKAKARAAAINGRLTEGFSEEELRIVARWLTDVCDRFKKGNADE